MTVGDKVAYLRELLKDYPMREDCRSFAGRPVYTLGMSFFPGDLGLYDSGRSSISTIILGTDWGNERSFEKELAALKYRSNATVRNADKMLSEAGFDLNDCFYSNAWPVMRAGGAPEQNHHPMREDPDFTNAYRRFLRVSIEILEPKIVISLGNPCAWFLGPFFGPDWKPGRLSSPSDVRIAHLNEEPLRVRDGIVFVTATHPSHLNNRAKRTLSAEYGNECGLLMHARRLAGVADAPGWAPPEPAPVLR